MIIGIDHGYGCMKTSHTVFTTGLTAYEKEPYTMKNVIKHDGKYYVCGSGRQSLIKDKTADDSYFILTLAAIAKELKFRDADTKASIILSVGLPLTNFGREKEKFIKYLKRNAFCPIKFEFEGIPYKITIDDVQVFPQGYSAIFNHLDKLQNEPSVILCDVGSWTVDAMRIDNGTPNSDTCRSLELGVIRMTDRILEEVRRNTGLSITQAQIERVLKNEPCSMDEKAKDIILEQGKSYVNKLFRALNESGFDVAAVPIIFMGGGALLIKQNLGKNRVTAMSIINDIKANAIGYESIAHKKIGAA